MEAAKQHSGRKEGQIRYMQQPTLWTLGSSGNFSGFWEGGVWTARLDRRISHPRSTREETGVVGRSFRTIMEAEKENVGAWCLPSLCVFSFFIHKEGRVCVVGVCFYSLSFFKKRDRDGAEKPAKEKGAPSSPPSNTQNSDFFFSRGVVGVVGVADDGA
mmetsp:Transcript_24441/g.78925  ORF Transcript_24441/g.78925 Transcript_24441/m.78925 type:complete len:159 (-) Transcript_24441:1208-1684(-)